MNGSNFILFCLGHTNTDDLNISAEEANYLEENQTMLYNQFKTAFMKTVQPIIEKEITDIFNSYTISIKDLGFYDSQSTLVNPMKWSISRFNCTVEAGSSAESFFNSLDTEWYEDIQLNDIIDMYSPDFNFLAKFLYNYLIQNDISPLLEVTLSFTEEDFTDKDKKLIHQTYTNLHSNQLFLEKDMFFVELNGAVI